MKTKLSGRFWCALTIFSLIGQVAWVVENMYFNVFIYKIFNASASDISTMVAASAVAATVTTVFIGALSDRIGKRKLFICGGYILWGISIFSFAFIRTDIIEGIFPAAVSAATVGVSLVIIMDCVMTFFGSSANDAAFNAWLTDSTDSTNRGAAEGINAMMPLVAILVVFGGFMAFNLDEQSSWTSIFIIIGAVVLIVGIIGLFIIKEPKIKPSKTGYIKNILYGFMPSTVKSHKGLYISLIAFIIFNISIQIFMPYLIIYYEVSLGMTDYVFIMAPAIVIASVVTAFWGKVYDKKGFGFSSLFSLVWLIAGYVLLYFFKSTLPVFIGSLLMMSGYLSGMAVFGAVIRDKTPLGKAGMLQGVRIFSQVLIPGLIGPYIGKTVLKNAEVIIGNDGTESFVPNENIFLAAMIPIVVLIISVIIRNLKKKPRTIQLKTDYDIGETPHGYYPRPTMKRESFQCLNGEWDLFINRKGDLFDAGKVIVPFPIESGIQNIKTKIKKNDIYVYHKKFDFKKTNDKVILNFGAVDCITEVTLNNKFVGSHKGGYLPFSFDITTFINEGANELSVSVIDKTDRTELYGKQRKNRGGMWYTPISGIWQSVWIEEVPNEYIEKIKISPTTDSVKIEVFGGEREKTIIFDQKEYKFSGDEYTLEIHSPVLWTPDNPHIYNFQIKSGKDKIESYFALREVSIGDKNGQSYILLNKEPYFFHGLLDQGYYSDGIYTPLNADGFRDDILRMKELGFNMLRKHIKIEPEIFYYYCDIYGMAVFQDMVNNGKYNFLLDTALPTLNIKKGLERKGSKYQRETFLNSAKETVELLYNHPSILYYTIYNEGWGQPPKKYADKVYSQLKNLDSTRIYDTASGWFKGVKTDVQSEHVYFKKIDFEVSKSAPSVLSEFGGYSYKTDEHSFNLDKTYGYKICPDKESFTKDLDNLYTNEILPMIDKGLCAAVLTQVSDVEDETNGLLTYDRKVIKPDELVMKEISRRIFERFKEKTK